jgi:signal transduction histidine kinase
VHVDASPVQGEIDPPKVERIVENLLSNVARHTPAGTPVWVAVRPDRDGVLLSVEDAGPGIPPEIRESIFEPFRQGQDTVAHSPGMGLGLSLVARFAELHGGRAWVEERTGGGAAFRVFLGGVHEPEPVPASIADFRENGSLSSTKREARPAEGRAAAAAATSDPD